MPTSLKSIHDTLRRLGGWGSVYIPEFTYGGLRVDAAVVDVRTRWIRGFEIKMSRSDWVRDEKWMHYAEFLSSLSVVCPAGLIQPSELDGPFGLLWILDDSVTNERFQTTSVKWVKKPKRFQRRDGLAWLFTYVRVIEAELPRLNTECERLRRELKRADEEKTAQLYGT